MKKHLMHGKIKVMLGAAVCTLLILCITIYLMRRSQNNNEAKPGTTIALAPMSPSPTVNYKPATDDEKQQAEDHKSELASTTPTPTSASMVRVKPIIINAYYSAEKNQLVISGIVPGVLETGGTCTAVAEHDSSRIIKTIAGAADANTTNCPPVNLSKTELGTSGTWGILLEYKSARASGASDKREVSIP